MTVPFPTGSNKASLMLQELRESGAVCERILLQNSSRIRELAKHLRKREPPIIITCARGSSDMAASYAKTLFESRLGTIVASYSPSMSSIYDTKFRKLDNAVFIIISQSGRSPDIIASLTAAKEAGAFTIAMVNDENSPAAHIADFVLPLCAGPEKSVAATKSFIASLIVICNLIAEWQDDAELKTVLLTAPQTLNHAAELDWDCALDILVPVSNMFVLGRSLTFGIAGEAALKLKETSSIHAEAFSAAEVKHGPMALVKDNFPVLMFPPLDAAREQFSKIACDFSERGAQCLMVGDRSEHALHLPAVGNLHPLIDPIAKILSFYNFAQTLSCARGLDPDTPPFLQKVTQTK
jgi:glucosamine--fructose-6-phosphate aminotransferase (isomerizing)